MIRVKIKNFDIETQKAKLSVKCIKMYNTFLETCCIKPERLWKIIGTSSIGADFVKHFYAAQNYRILLLKYLAFQKMGGGSSSVAIK